MGTTRKAALKIRDDKKSRCEGVMGKTKTLREAMMRKATRKAGMMGNDKDIGVEDPVANDGESSVEDEENCNESR